MTFFPFIEHKCLLKTVRNRLVVVFAERLAALALKCALSARCVRCIMQDLKLIRSNIIAS